MAADANKRKRIPIIKRIIGRKLAKFTAPTQALELVSWFMYQRSAVVCIKVPTFERNAPDQRRLKSL